MGSAKADRAQAKIEKLKKDKQFLENQLTIAADIQSYLLPKRIPRIEGYEMAAFYQPCDYVGGDYYDFIEIDEQHLGFLVADVAGKGFPGALVMTQVRTLMRSEALHSLSPREVLIRMNRYLYQEVPRGMFITMFYAVLDIPHSVVTCASAGHNPLLYWYHAQQKPDMIKPSGLALAVDSGRRFEPNTNEVEIRMLPGDRFTLYTDGVTEAMDKKSELYGEGRLTAVFKETIQSDCHKFLAVLVESLNDYRGKAPQHDDITVIALRRTTENPSKPTGFSYIEGERYVRCSGCGNVNAKVLGRCPTCSRSTEGTAIAHESKPAPGVTQCTACKRIFRNEGWRDGCPYCSKRLCMMCGVRTASLGMYCEACAPKNLQS
jgi:serine phosphatase RsbU (regulator of sigma subunit)